MIGERIRRAREGAGLSLRDLAAKVGVTAPAVQKWEKGTVVPGSRVLIDLGRALGVRVEFFLRPRSVDLEAPRFRKRRMPEREHRKLEARALERLERYLDLLELLAEAGIPRRSFAPPPGLPARVDSAQGIEAAAEAVRQAWGLGGDPLPQLADLLEEQGILVLALPVHDARFDGLSARVDGAPVIVIGAEWPGDRQRFTLAHELGHLILDGRLPDQLEEQESPFDRFAGAFLLPRSTVLDALGPRREWLSEAALVALKQRHGVSMRAWLYRAKDLGILGPEQAARHWRRANSWRPREPGPALPPELPTRFLRLVYRAQAEGIIGDARAAELLGVPVDQVGCGPEAAGR